MKKLFTVSATLLFISLSLIGRTLYENTGEDKIAIKGYDVVSYFTDSKAEKGEAKYSHTWNNQVWHFSSQTHKELFAKNPEKYAPQYGGFCAFAMAFDQEAPVDPEHWDIVDGKLYLNYNQETQKKWSADIPAQIKKADINWRKR
jgi:YHS domain-containing protein